MYTNLFVCIWAPVENILNHCEGGRGQAFYIL